MVSYLSHYLGSWIYGYSTGLIRWNRGVRYQVTSHIFFEIINLLSQIRDIKGQFLNNCLSIRTGVRLDCAMRIDG